MNNLQSVEEKFEKHSISTDVVLPGVKLLDHTSRFSPGFTDTKYLPFYYRLGCELNPNNVIQVGSNLGLVGAAFLRGCKTVHEWVVFDTFVNSSNIVISNLNLFGNLKVSYHLFDLSYRSKLQESFDLAFLSQFFGPKETDIFLDFLWSQLKSEGFLVVDYVEHDYVKESFFNFCKIKNREPFLFKTRYGVGIIKR